jgi:DNA repair protein SbcC/Rad50
MKIELKTLALLNFKGARSLTVNFNNQTEISGANATGKTRIFDAFTWLMFGKDSEDKKDFNIKTLDSNNEALHRADHSVIGLLSVDGRNVKLDRTYKEKWVKKRGEEIPEFAGHETTFAVNGVPYQQKDYNEYIETILPESLFKQVTNPGFFNSMKWTDRRAMLFQIAGDVRNSDIILINPKLQVFYEMLAGKSIEKYKMELSTKKKLLKETNSTIPARIDEVIRAIVPDPDYNQVNTDISKFNKRISEIDMLINSDANKFNALNEANQKNQNKIYEFRRQVNELYSTDRSKAENANFDLKQKKSWLEISINNFKNDIDSFKDRIRLLEKQKADIENENNSLRKDWTDVNESVLKFNENEFICPACSRPFKSNDIEAKKAEMRISFNKSKTEKLESITNTGKQNAAEIAKINEDITKLALQVTGNSIAIEAKQKEFVSIIIPENPEIPLNPEITRMQDEIKTLEASIKPLAKIDNSSLTKEKAEIYSALDGLKMALNIKTENEKREVRKQELIDQERNLSQQIADLERQEFQCEAFTRAKIGMIEEKINSMFSFVKFKMFNTLVNGGVEEVCDTLINGVPYADTNNAAKIQGGMDIISTLSKHYDVYAPIWIDNRESVTEIPQMDCQVISLYVDHEQKELLVKHQINAAQSVTITN